MQCSIIIGVKNRLSHFFQTYSSMVTQLGVSYELIIVDFFSSDGIESVCLDLTNKYSEIMSPYLTQIKYVRLLEDRPYNPRECKNLGARCSEGDILSFSDVDVFLGMNYLHKLSSKVAEGRSFVATRSQESMSSSSKRILDYINYGNMIVSKTDFCDVNGFDESINFYGGDDDDVFHRLKLKGLREINPYDHLEACHFSILHGDDLRLNELEDKERRDPKVRFEDIYGNKDFRKSKCDFLKEGADRKETIIFQRTI